MPGIEVSLAGAFLAGLISFATPCVLPIVPSFLAYLGGTTAAELAARGAAAAPVRRRLVGATLAFVLGFATVFVALGLTASWIGKAMAQHYDALRWVAGGLLVALGLHFLGAFRIGLLYRDARVHPAGRPAGLIGAYAVGLAFAFGWSPCVGPVLAGVLMVAGAEARAGEGAALLGAYALGMGLPFLLAAAAAPSALGLVRRLSRHLGLIEKLAGVLLIATGIAFVAGIVPDIAAWMLRVFPAFQRMG